MCSVSPLVLGEVIDALRLDRTSQHAWTEAKKRLKELAMTDVNRIPTVVFADVCDLLRLSEPSMFSKMSRVKHYVVEASLALCTRVCEQGSHEKLVFLRDKLCLISTLSDTLVYYLDKKCLGKDSKERMYALNYLKLAAKVCRGIQSDRVQAFHLLLLPALIDFLNEPKEEKTSNETHNTTHNEEDKEQTMRLARRYIMALFVSLARKSPDVLAEALGVMSDRQLHSFINDEEEPRSRLFLHQLNFCLSQMAVTADSVLPQFVATVLTNHMAGEAFQEAFKEDDDLSIRMLADFFDDLKEALETLESFSDQREEQCYEVLSLMQTIVRKFETSEGIRSETENSSFRLIRALLAFEEITRSSDVASLVAKVATIHLEGNNCTMTLDSFSEELVLCLDEIIIRLPFASSSSNTVLANEDGACANEMESHILGMLEPAVLSMSKVCFKDDMAEGEIRNKETFNTIITTLLHCLKIEGLKRTVLDALTPDRFSCTWRRVVSTSQIGDQPLIRTLLDISHDLKTLSADWNEIYETITARPLENSTWVELLASDVRYPQDKDAILRHVYSQSKSGDANSLKRVSSSSMHASLSSSLSRKEVCLRSNGPGAMDMREFEHVLEKLRGSLASMNLNANKDDFTVSRNLASEVFALSEMMLQNERIKRRALTRYLSLADETVEEKSIIIQTLEGELETLRRVLMSTVHGVRSVERRAYDFKHQVEALKEEATRFKEEKTREVESSNERLRLENADIVSKAQKYKEQVETLREVNNEHFQAQEEFRIKLQEEVLSNTALAEGIEKRDQRIKSQEKQLAEIKGKMSKELEATKREVSTLSQVCREQEQSLARKEKELQKKAEELKRIQSILKQIHN